MKDITPNLSHFILASANSLIKINEGHSIEYISSWIPENLFPFKKSILSYVKQSIRNLGCSKAIIKKFINKEPDKLVINILYVAISLLIESKFQDFTIINQAVLATKINKSIFHASGLINAVLRKINQNLEQLKREYYTQSFLPIWWLEKLKNIDVENYLSISKLQPAMGLRINPLKISTQDYFNLLALENIEARIINLNNLTPYAIVLPKQIAVEKLPFFSDGYLSVQDIAAQLSPQLLNLKDGDKILDACSSPGGKILSCLEQFKLHTTIIDVNSEKIDKVFENLDRLKLNHQCLSLNYHINDASSLHWWNKEQFDYIIADVPCSASGIVRKYPEIALIRQAKDLKNLQKLQKDIIQNLWQTLKKSGVLLYITCSVFEEEGIKQIQYFLDKNKDAKCISNIGQIEVSLNNDGFFYALLQKVN